MWVGVSMVRMRSMTSIAAEIAYYLVWSVMIIAVRAKWITVFLAAMFAASCGSKNEPPATPTPAPPPQAAAPDNRPVVVAFGDSLTAGYGVEPGKSYPDDLQKLLDSGGYRYRVVNAGVSGETTTDGLQRVNEVLALKPALVILEFGGNDGLRGLPVTTTGSNLNDMIQAILTAGPKVLLAGITLPPNYGADYIRQFEQVYVTAAAKFKVPRIPFLLTGVADHRELMQADGIHPTAAGCKIVSSNVFKYLKDMLKP